MKKWHWFLLSVFIVLVDQGSKYWAGVALIPYKPWSVFPMLNFTLAFNTGAAFSFLNGAGEWHRWFFAIFSFVMSVILILWLLRLRKEDRWLSLGISLVLGGAVGNLIDRAFYGYVVDFIDVYYDSYHFATFNIADSAICLGAACFIIDALCDKKSKASCKKESVI